MESQYYLAIAVAFFGFLGLAFLLLYPVLKFMKREEEVAKQWTVEALAKRQKREKPSGDGASGEPEPPTGP